MSEIEILKANLAEAAKHIEWLLPFAKAKASESGNTAGLVMNAQDFLKSPIIVKVRMEVCETP